MRLLLIITGLLNAAFVAFHVFLGLQISHWTALPIPFRGLMQGFNVSGVLVLTYLAFALLVRGKEVLGTGLGAATLALGALIYLSRAVEEFIWLAGNLKIAAACIVVGLLHVILFTGVRVTRPVT
jgi:hypothetical protein